MKKNYFLASILFCLFLSVDLRAQLNGAYTINNTLPASASNFTSFTAFSNSINVGGVSGPVTINVMNNGTFNEQVNFNQAAGISSTNTVTINGNGSTITFNATVATLRHTILLTGADYMTFNNLTIAGTNTTNALSCHLWAGANNNAFNNCTFNAPLIGTGTFLCPFSVSGTSVSATATGLSGNTNAVVSCTVNGGYYGISLYAATAAPFPTGSILMNNVIKDFYTTGIYHYYNHGTLIKGNRIERPNRNNLAASEGITIGTSCSNVMVESNIIRRLAHGLMTTTSAIYGIQITGDASANNENIIRNNLICEINSTGLIYGIYLPSAAFANVFHNTVSLDDISATAGNTYGIYSTGPNEKIKNNIITISRGGAGAKYGIFLTTGATNLQSDHNDVYVSSTTGTGNLPFYLGSGFTLPAWQFANPTYDQGSKDADPMYTNPSAMNYVPTSTVINNMCPYIGVNTDITNFTRSLATPDPGAYEFFILPCTGTPPANSVVTPTYVSCPNTSMNISIANSFTNTGYNIQWQVSTGNILGPYNAVPGATLPTFNTGNLTQTVYYNALIYCVNGGSTITATPGIINIALPTTNTVPYFESFEGITNLNELPNCSWRVTNSGGGNSGGSTLTYTSNGSGNRYPHTGTKFAAFASTPAGTSYFYSNGIYMQPGITYSASIWYINEAIGYNAWSDLSILVGSSQSPSGLVPVASTTAGSFGYMPLSNTFTVPTAGLYYMAIRASTSSNNSPYLSWDDLQVIIPCSLNSPALTINSQGSTICSGQQLVVTASGANTYSLNGIPSSSLIALAPPTTTMFVISGSNTLSACSSSVNQVVTVNPSPPVSVFATSLNICEGQSTTLYAQGATSFNWAHGVMGSPVSVNPLATTIYSVVGLNAFGCATMQSIQITVNTLPVITAGSTGSLLCKGESVTLTGNGAITYQWASTTNLVQSGNPLTFAPQNSGGYTVTGTDANGCVGKSFLVLNVEDCTGIGEMAEHDSGILIYPNPTAGIFNLESNGYLLQPVEFFDIAGRKVMCNMINTSSFDISSLPSGIYTLKVSTEAFSKFIKVVKTSN